MKEKNTIKIIDDTYKFINYENIPNNTIENTKKNFIPGESQNYNYQMYDKISYIIFFVMIIIIIINAIILIKSHKEKKQKKED